MRLIHTFPHTLPLYWPDSNRQSYIIDDGSDETLQIEYQDVRFAAHTITPELAAEMRATYQSQDEYERQHHEV